MDPVRARITEKRPFLRSAEKCFFLPKMGFIPKNHPKFLKRLIFIWEKATFFFGQLFPAVARTLLELRSVTFFLGPKSRFLVQRSNFCRTTPIFVNDPFLALGMTVHFLPWEWFFDFPFWGYSSFRKKKSGWPVKKSSPYPLWGHRLPVTALARAG